MIVSKLIQKLKKMPQSIEVKYACHDNAECEASGVVFSMFLFEKDDFDRDKVEDKSMFDSMPKRCVILRG